ncbi:hypothetical protein QN277_011759 [Acacia crassicarpa]|uniref:Leucine-rich repeat-containing N-terminal plant-type domain-containing protein n=1 Tax=Acacia crassicarpa TaxID=499986 RepID=A0AAE1MZ55_9FABA|nr:hypothetical protein QN277_011759 [Acacia crassicarpa]
MGMCFIIGFALIFLLSEISQFGLCGRCIESEKRALLKFKTSFHDDPYNRLSSWSPKTNCCRWHGIACHNITGHVLKLDLNFDSLEAIGVDPSLLELKHLIYLDLSGNNFNAISIPILFGSMEGLSYLSISESNFKGMIPSNLGGNLTNLQFLDVRWNHLHTNDMSWVSDLQSLQYLNLSDVYLGEAHNLFQVLHMLPSLLQHQLEGCGLGNLFAPFPSINSTYNARVEVLSLAGNEIDGQIFNAFQNWTSLEFLDLYSNNFSSMPSWFGEFKNLVFIDLSWNALCGPIPVVLRNMTSLEYLDLSSNNFSLIPSLLGELKRLRYLDISKNRIIATAMDISVSQILKNKCHLKIFYFDTSNLQGEAFGDLDSNMT